MGPLRWFLFVYVLGGLTFIPLLIAAVLAFAYYTLPPADDESSTAKAKDSAQLQRAEDEDLLLRTGTDDLAEKFHRKHDSDVAAGYFAVCREWVPGGVNGKPPDRLSPAGETIATESPSVYQTMYRSLFSSSQKPTIEPQKDGAGKNIKRANNIFFVVLRHGHLMLYDDNQQLEVRYVISLEYHDVDIYAGDEEPIPEGELWVKRHAIRLTRKRSKDPSQKPSLPFFLFGENLSEKEDFYHALLKNQERTAVDSPIAEDFDTSYIVKLVQKLHSSEEQLQTRWLNAFIGRLFLATYKTPEFEEFIRSKLSKKISRVKKPTFITRISLRKIDTGTSGPFVTNPRLKDLTVNGDCVAEADVEYNGGFRIEIGATARIDLGKRFGAREVDMVLACTLKRVQGHVLVRCKPPPSNRIWFTFEKMPQLDLALEPIVSTRKITYSVILGAIESRIREVFTESLVMPFWDDVPFFDTMGQKHRGGIWKREKSDTSVEIKDDSPEDEAQTSASGDNASSDVSTITVDDRNYSMPTLAGNDPNSTDGLDNKSYASLPVPEVTPSEGDKTPPARPPRALRAMSFANAADPAVTTNNVDSDAGKVEADSTPKRDSARDILKDLSARSGSPLDPLGDSPPVEPAMAEAMKARTDSNVSKTSVESMTAPGRASTVDMTRSTTSSAHTSRPGTPSEMKRSSLHEDQKSNKALGQAARSLTAADRKQALASATAAAQKWSTLGWGVLNRNKQKDNHLSDHPPQTPSPSGPPSEPMGRGQPLPPPGQPLPGPRKQNTIMSNIPFMIPRKPTLPKRPDAPETAESASTSKSASPKPPPLPERRRRKSTMHNSETSEYGDDLLVVEAPTESGPNSPEAERFNNASRDDFFGHGEEETEEERRSGLDERRYQQPVIDTANIIESRDKRQARTSDVSPEQGDLDTKQYDRMRDDSPSDKENNGHLDYSRQRSESEFQDPPRPPPPARTNSAASDRRSSRIPAPVSSTPSSIKRKPLSLHRQPSNLSSTSGSSPQLGSGDWTGRDSGGVSLGAAGEED
ncbi:uncharacterized protein HMPREF1541_02529 [Cyphellophora europaea CBS 101466]|uniref:SMP-LTD domain-containing protein n=1 Tax=Cyphellophora europaea (strain CBS 101466) TaxID=1220924 RepID=W2S468_CYPE1|nr:uncharacterized protein HMPREF1541_02529 [Cyphellophora europaea CBS 101466]ETN43370.1 hypothetical protein HMPREF1541_02529 [Cyphellophora europaea CBS 101466]